MNRRKKRQPKKYDLHRTMAYSPSYKAQKPRSPNSPYITPDFERTREQDKKPKFWTWKKMVLLLFIILLIPLLVIGIWDYRNFSRASQNMFGSGNMLSLLATSPLKSTNEGRTIILLVGYSVDDPAHKGAKLTDSIMILSLDKSNKTGHMLSVPRDLYVKIPNYGKAKINEAYQAGERKSGDPNEGVNLLKEVIAETFAVDIHYYAIINYASVRSMVDALGGVEVNIESPDPKGIYDPNFLPHEGGPLKLENGKQKIDGQTALRLTRARGSTYGSYGFPQSDFNRTVNQQKVLSAIKSEISWTLILDPRTNEKIFNSVSDNVQTDIKISEVLPVFRLFNAVPSQSLKPVALNNVNGVNLLTSYGTSNGQSALVPAAGINDYSDIQRSLKQLGF